MVTLDWTKFVFFFIVGGIQSTIVLYISEIADNKWVITNGLLSLDLKCVEFSAIGDSSAAFLIWLGISAFCWLISSEHFLITTLFRVFLCQFRSFLVFGFRLYQTHHNISFKSHNCKWENEIKFWINFKWICVFSINYLKLQKAEKSLKFYKGFTGNNIDEHIAFNAEFHRLKSIANEQKADEKTPLRHICK